MSNKTKWIIGGVLAFVLVVGCCLYFIPKTTPFDITLNATKTGNRNGEHEDLGTVEIHVYGTVKEYLFRSDKLELHIDDFDHLYDIKPFVASDRDGFTVDMDGDSHGFITGLPFGASSNITGENTVLIWITLQSDLKKWEFSIHPGLYVDEEEWDEPSYNLRYDAVIE